MIHQTIYETMYLEEEDVVPMIGAASTEGIRRRRAQIKLFLENNEWSESAFMDYLRGNPQLPSNTSVVFSAIDSTKKAFASKFKKASDAKQKERYDICENHCDLYRKSDGRCSKCGCYVAYKSKLVAWHCPVGKW